MKVIEVAFVDFPTVLAKSFLYILLHLVPRMSGARSWMGLEMTWGW